MKRVENVVEYKSLDELYHLDRNPRTISKQNMDKLVKSIKDNPDYFEARPIICSDRTGKLVIIAGNQRLRAAGLVGLSEVPVVTIHGLSEEREREITIRDNVELGDWDYEILANEWDAEELEKWGGEKLLGGVGNGIVDKLKQSDYVEKEQYFIKKPFVLIFYDETTEEKLAEVLGVDDINKDVYDAKDL